MVNTGKIKSGIKYLILNESKLCFWTINENIWDIVKYKALLITVTKRKMVKLDLYKSVGILVTAEWKKIISISVANITASKIIFWIIAAFIVMSKHIIENKKFIKKNVVKLIISFSNAAKRNAQGKNNNNPINITINLDLSFML